MKYYVAHWGRKISCYFDTLDNAKLEMEKYKKYSSNLVLLSCTNNYRNRQTIEDWESEDS